MMTALLTHVPQSGIANSEPILSMEGTKSKFIEDIGLRLIAFVVEVKPRGKQSLNILLTGGTGYIGSHIATALCAAGYRVVLFDNLTNSTLHVVKRINTITGVQSSFIQGDIRDTNLLRYVLRREQIAAVIHCAGLKSVVQSIANPTEYYSNNVVGTLNLLEAMNYESVKSLVFSSSATVYGEPQYLPVDENHPTNATNPYGRSKRCSEEILRDVATSDAEWRIVCLRYFNPVGAHETGLIGEIPSGAPSNLIPFVTQVAAGERACLHVFGSDYETPDGTGLRDYIHVLDLAEGHVEALSFLLRTRGWHAFNLGTGHAYSVLQMVRSFEIISGRGISLKVMPRRPGDVPVSYANADKANSLMGWVPKRSLEEMVASAWLFQQKTSDLN